MISFNEILGKISIADVSINTQQAIDDLLVRLNQVRTTWGKPMVITSGLRDWNDMLRIYRAKGIKDDKIPRGSAHLYGMAADISDPHGELYQWLKEDPAGIAIMEQAGLYGELDTKGWVHLQSRVPGSGHRWFKA